MRVQRLASIQYSYGIQLQNFHLRVLGFALVVILLSVVFSVIVSYAMYLKLHSDVTSFAEESSHQSSIELMELRASLKRLHEELRSKEARNECDVSLGWSVVGCTSVAMLLGLYPYMLQYNYTLA